MALKVLQRTHHRSVIAIIDSICQANVAKLDGFLFGFRQRIWGSPKSGLATVGR
jgi:hypothetical protein